MLIGSLVSGFLTQALHISITRNPRIDFFVFLLRDKNFVEAEVRLLLARNDIEKSFLSKKNFQCASYHVNLIRGRNFHFCTHNNSLNEPSGASEPMIEPMSVESLRVDELTTIYGSFEIPIKANKTLDMESRVNQSRLAISKEILGRRRVGPRLVRPCRLVA